MQWENLRKVHLETLRMRISDSELRRDRIFGFAQHCPGDGDVVSTKLAFPGSVMDHWSIISHWSVIDHWSIINHWSVINHWSIINHNKIAQIQKHFTNCAEIEFSQFSIKVVFDVAPYIHSLSILKQNLGV